MTFYCYHDSASLVVHENRCDDIAAVKHRKLSLREENAGKKSNFNFFWKKSPADNQITNAGKSQDAVRLL